MATAIEALQQVAEVNLGFYAFCFADEIAVSEVEAVAEWADNNSRMFFHVSTEVDEATTITDSLKGTGLYHHCISYHQDYSTVGAVMGMALDQRYDRQDGVKTLHMKSLKGVTPSDITQTDAQKLKESQVNFYSRYGNANGNLSVFTGGYAGDGMFFDFIIGVDWLRNNIENKVFNGQRARRSTPQSQKGMMMIKADIASAMNDAVNVGLVGAGTWNGQGIGEVDSGDYLANGYYIHHESILTQAQSEREKRIAPPFTVLAKGAGAFHNIDITLIPEQ